jgi:hypothetical protein
MDGGVDLWRPTAMEAARATISVKVWLGST